MGYEAFVLSASSNFWRARPTAALWGWYKKVHVQPLVSKVFPVGGCILQKVKSFLREVLYFNFGRGRLDVYTLVYTYRKVTKLGNCHLYHAALSVSNPNANPNVRQLPITLTLAKI